MTAPSTQHATPDPRLQCGILKKPKYLYSYTIKNFIKVKHSWKRISEQARIRKKKEFAVGTSNYHPHPTPDPLPLAFQVLFQNFSVHPPLRQWDIRERRVGKGQNTPETKSVGPTVQKSQRTGWKLPVSQKSAGALHMQPWKILGS